jgi:chemotaxis response regulator CheB
MTSPNNFTVLVLKSDALLKRAVLSLMNLEKELEIVVSEAVDINKLATDVSKINPNVVLLSESQPLAAKETVAQLLVSHPKIRIVIVSVNTNWLHIYDKEDKLLTKLEDLLTVIKD